MDVALGDSQDAHSATVQSFAASLGRLKTLGIHGKSQQMTRQKKQSIALFMLGSLSVLGMFVGSNEPILPILENTWVATTAYRLHLGNSIIYDLSTGILVSIFFWWLLVSLPQTKKNKIIKSTLQRHYGYFKEDTIQILLFAGGNNYEADVPEQLLSRDAFKNYFKANNMREWYATLNGLQDEPSRINDLLIEMDLLCQEISYFLSNVEIENDDAHAFFKRLTAHIYKLKHSSTYTNDQVKYLGNFIWEIFTGWSIIDGYRKSDLVQDMIDSI